MKTLGILLTALLTLVGATPSTPVRHLEYAFAIYPTAKPNGGYYNGTLSVDILGTAPDGGTLVQASEWWYYTLRPRQTRECELYPDGTVVCNDVPPYPSETELVLFPLLARDFFSRASSTASSSWQQQYRLTFSKGLFVTSVSFDLSATPQSDGRTLKVASTGTIRQLDRRQIKVNEEGQFVYDRAAALPLVVHDERGPTPTQSIYTRTSVDLLLMKDSAATNLSTSTSLGPVRFVVTDVPATRVPIPRASILP